MIKRLKIKNFQSHQDTELEFHPGFNSIVGTTDSGKSSLYRAIHWIKSNKATNFISFWNRKKNGDPKEETSAEIELEDISIQRIRSSDMNGYKLGEETLEAVGRGEPPTNVTDSLNMSDINFFSQHNPPFLLTESAGQVAGIFNELIHLDAIDTVLSKLDSAKRDVKKQLVELYPLLGKTEGELSSLSWVDEAKGLLDQMQETEENITEISAVALAISEKIQYIKEADKRIEQLSVFESAFSYIKEMEEISKEMEEVVAEHTNLSRILSSVKSLDESLTSLKALDMDSEIEHCDTIYNELEQITTDLASLTEWITAYKAKGDSISRLTKELEENEGQLPGNCPLCGALLEECGD